jgi:hypothetical protein
MFGCLKGKFFSVVSVRAMELGRQKEGLERQLTLTEI